MSETELVEVDSVVEFLLHPTNAVTASSMKIFFIIVCDSFFFQSGFIGTFFKKVLAECVPAGGFLRFPIIEMFSARLISDLLHTMRAGFCILHGLNILQLRQQ